MASPEAVSKANHLVQAVAGFGQTIAAALDDGKVSLAEGIQLGVQALGFASTLQAALKDASPALRAEVIAVLKTGQLQFVG